MLKSICFFLMFATNLAQANIDIFANLEKDVKLTIGSPAPKLSDVTWMNQAPLEMFENPDRIYFVEFWGTWCGPCVSAIPHLNELAKKYGNQLQIVGIAAREQGESRTERLENLDAFFKDPESPVQEYPVAYGGPEVRDRWLTASLARGIPNGYLVHNGKVFWEGHPMMVDQVIAEAIDGSYDMQAAKKELMKEKIQIVAKKRLKAALQTHASVYQKLVWARIFNEEYDDSEAKVIELDLLAQMGPTRTNSLNTKVNKLIVESDFNFALFMLHAFLETPRLHSFVSQATGAVIEKFKALTKEDADFLRQYAHFYFKDLVDALMKERRHEEALLYTHEAITAMNASSNKPESIQTFWSETFAALQSLTTATVSMTSDSATVNCEGGVCEVPVVPAAECDQVLNQAPKAS